MIPNHEEALVYAQMHPESNLAACYLDLRGTFIPSATSKSANDPFFETSSRLSLEELHERVNHVLGGREFT